MIRNRLAALILTGGLGFLSGCTAYYSVGLPSSDCSFGSGGGGGLFGHRRAPAAAPCATGFGAPGCCETGVLAPDGFPGPDFAITPPAAIPGIPPTASPPNIAPPSMPMIGEPPLGNNTKFSPAPKSIPFAYTPTGY